MAFGILFSFLITFGGIIWLLLIFLKSISVNDGSTFKKSKKISKKEPKIINNENIDESLMNKIKRLKLLYENNTLTKAEFEKAKNKLLK